MRPHPRIRKTVKWGGAVVCVLLLGLWVVSGWYEMSPCSWNGCEPLLRWGCCEFWKFPDQAPSFRGVRIARMLPFLGGDCLPFEVHWDFRRWNAPASKLNGSGWACLVVPLWAPLLLAIIVTSLAWLLDTLARRRAKLGACPKCSYSRTGLAVGGVCPECGAPAPTW